MTEGSTIREGTPTAAARDGAFSREALLRRWGRWRRLSDEEAERAAEDWRRVLEVRQAVRLARVDRLQVTDHRGRRGCSLVGVVYNNEEACIYHTRALIAEDIVHELLHARHPQWSEAAVVAETDRLVGPRPVLRRARLARLVPSGAGLYAERRAQSEPATA